MHSIEIYTSHQLSKDAPLTVVPSLTTGFDVSGVFGNPMFTIIMCWILIELIEDDDVLRRLLWMK